MQIELRFPRDSAFGDATTWRSCTSAGARARWCRSARSGSSSTRLEYKTIYHKNLRPVAYAFARGGGPSAGRRDHRHASWTASRTARRRRPPSRRPVDERTWLSPGGGDPWSLPVGYTVDWAGEGEWKITLDVFRDLGIAFVAAQIGIF